MAEQSKAVIWIIDAEQWPRALLRAELIERGFDAVGYVTVRDAIDSLPERAPRAVIVDLRGQPLPLVQRLPALRVPILVIGGALELSELPEDAPWTAILRRPIAIGEIVERVTAALPRDRIEN